ncbi:type II toxin-antitoxin system RelE/ParE family toxin [Bifidobacterium jacchi]|uniref:Type II toxin-antitoxin system RelE/ParE family toxin n=1 Tax=Bifidobacterium jacchi TaxID=2490545 RepID=A0A5N5RM05_9BIFI|nr:type II toxin-antitoxin system RelE/ParE family toxin [Bifidobacterium jacchi]KAB5608372.1 type II toxin-antitoxin system RelE/ParE family toxin [Bifidobacterium jacchi]
MEIKQSAEFAKWFRKLRNRQAKAAIAARLDAIRLAGHPLGDIKPVGGPVSEMRFHLGAGYRVYYAMEGDVLMLLLAGGDKNTQQADIKRAHSILDDHKEQQ